MSRVAQIEICSACGCHENMLPAVGRELSRPGQWPILTPWDVTTPLSQFRVLQHLGIRVSGVAARLRELRSQEAEARRKLGLPSGSTVTTEMSDSGRLLSALRGLETTGVVWGWEQREGDGAKGLGWWSDGAHLSGAAAVARPQELVWFDQAQVAFDGRGRLLERPHRWLFISVSDENTVGAVSESAANRRPALARRVELALRRHGLSAVPSPEGNVVCLMGRLV